MYEGITQETTTSTEELRQLLERELRLTVSYAKAEEIGRSLIAFFEIMSDESEATDG